MRLMQPFQHLPHNGARRFPVVGFFNRRTQLGMYAMPIQSRGILLPMLVTNRLPNVLEGFDILLVVQLLAEFLLGPIYKSFITLWIDKRIFFGMSPHFSELPIHSVVDTVGAQENVCLQGTQHSK